MKEALFSSCESWIVAALNLPEKYSGSFFSLLQQFWSIIWVVWNKQAACHLLLESHLVVQFHLIRVTTGMAVNTLRTLFLDIFSHGMVQYFLGVSTQFGNCRETSFCETGNWGLIPKYYVPLWNLDSCSFNPARKTHWSIFLFIKQQLWSCIWVFWKKQAVWLPLHAGSHLTVQFHLIRVTTGMTVNTKHSPLISFLMQWYSMS